MEKKWIEKMDKEKNIQKIEKFLYETCGCVPEEAVEILNECLRNARGKMYNMTFRGGRLQPNSSRYKPDWPGGETP